MKLRTKNTAIVLITLCIFSFLLSACSSEKSAANNLDVKKSTIMGAALKANNVPYVAIESKGSQITVTYESSDAMNYDSEIIVDWGYIFATAGMMNYSDIVIVNTVNGEPFAKLTTTGDNVFALSQGYINESVFWDNVDITSQ